MSNVETSKPTISLSFPSAQARHHDGTWSAVVGLRVDGRVLPVLVTVRGDETDASASRDELWTVKIFHAAKRLLEDRDLRAFQRNRGSAEIPEGDVAAADAPIPVSVPADYFAELAAAADIDRAARASFQHARNRLSEFAKYPTLKGDRTDALEMLNYLEALFEIGYPQNTNNQPLRDLRRAVSNILNRSDRRHHASRKDGDTIQSRVFALQEPWAWLQEPPVLKVQAR